MAHFDEALGETRASVTAEMEREYEQISQRLKQDAMSLQPIGFVTPGTMQRDEVKSR
jgi:transitional endoplasmic reticulum ATPase